VVLQARTSLRLAMPLGYEPSRQTLDRAADEL
jgi:hypothetical protein